MISNHNKLTMGMKSARDEFGAGEFEGAIKKYTEVINHRLADKRMLDSVARNRLAKAYIGRGDAKHNLGRHDDAIADYDEAIDLNPAGKKILSDAYTNRGFVKNELDRRKEAITDYDEAIRLNPKDAIAWNNRGIAKNKLGLHDDAIADYDEAIRLNPKDAEAWDNRGFAKHELGRHEEAIEDCTKAIDLNPENASALNNRGSAKGRIGRLEEALADLDEAIHLAPEDATAWSNRGTVKADLKRFADAIKDVEKALDFSPENPEIRNNLAAIKAEKSSHDAVEGRLGSLADTRELEEQAEKYKKSEEEDRRHARQLIKWLGILITILVAGLIVLVLWPECILLLECSAEIKPIDLASNPFSLLPFITLIIIITSPFVWAIRLRVASANKKELMGTEHMHLAYVEKRMLFYFAKDDAEEGKEIRADYIKATMAKSPANKLLALQNKASESSPNPAQNIVEKAASKVSDKSSS